MTNLQSSAGSQERQESFAPQEPPKASAYAEAERSRGWYAGYCRGQRFRFQVSEVVVLLVSASVPVVGIIVPSDAKWPALLGAVTTTFLGLRAVFHWRENWIRGTVACANIVAEMRLYTVRAEPYNDDSTRDAALMAKLNEIERNETQGWMASAKPDGGDQGRPPET